MVALSPLIRANAVLARKLPRWYRAWLLTAKMQALDV
jgi:hypothetical protein